MDKSLMLSELMGALEISKKTDFAAYLGISNQQLSNWFARKTFDPEVLYTKCEKINPEWILTGKGEIFKQKNVKKEKSYITEGKNHLLTDSAMPSVVTVDTEGKENILMVPVSARAGYLNGYGDKEYLGTLPAYRMPKLNNATFRMFEVAGHSMYPTIHQGAIAVGEWVDNFYQITDNNIYIILTKEDGIVIKRVLNRIDKYGQLYLKSDNRKEYPSYPIKPEEIIEIWKLSTAMIFDFQDPADLYDRVSDLEAKLLMITDKLPKK